jgi:heme o synthase
MIKTHYMLTKSGIIMGNVITTAGGFALASRGVIDYWLFVATMVGLSFIIASAGVFNNYMDRELDAKMERTKHRALVQGLISTRHAITFAIVLGVIGVGVLFFYTNLLALGVALAGFFIYVVLYGILKCRTIYGTIIGSLAGAVPPVVGYTAAGGSLDTAALLLFAMMVLWQMPHFFAIAIYRFSDYSAAGVPVLPVKKGMLTAKVHMLLYTIAFAVVALLFTPFGYTGLAYLIVALICDFSWIFLCIKGFKAEDDKIWARQMFVISLVIITALSVMLALDVQ